MSEAIQPTPEQIADRVDIMFAASDLAIHALYNRILMLVRGEGADEPESETRL